MESLLTQLLPIIGVILGASIQFMFSRATERSKEKQTLKTQAYTSYLKAIANLSMAQRFKLKDKIAQSTSELVESKVKIAIYGSKAVIDSLAMFERGGAKLDTTNQKKLFVEIGQNMRNDTVSKNEVVNNKELSQLMFSEDLD